MTLDQILLASILVGMFVVLALDRFRIEMVALAGLMLAFLVGLVPGSSVFSGLAHPAVITVAEILILVGALQASHILDHVALFLTRRMKTETALLLFLCSFAGFVSIFMNNIGALALMFPLATAVASRSGLALSRLLMPISFATLLGGTCSLIGTPANLIVSDALLAATGEGLGFFEFAKLGLPALLTGLLAIVFFVPRLLPATERPALAAESSEAGSISEATRLILEARISPRSSLSGLYLPAAEVEIEGRIESIRRNGVFVFGRRETIRLEPGDDLLIEGDRKKLDALFRNGMLRPDPSAEDANNIQRSAVVVPESVVLGSRISTLEGFSELGVQVTAITSPRKRLEGRFSDIQLAVGDVLHLSGPEHAVQIAIQDHGLLGVAAAETTAPLQSSLPPILGFFGAIALSATGLLRPELAFGLVIVVLMAFRQIDLTASIRRLNWPILVMLAAMIPLGNAVETTGMADLIANSFLHAVPDAGPPFILGAILVSAIVITPFVNNASTAIVLAPIALEVAARTGIAPELVMLTVAVGVSIDFLTPFGHHNNTIVMGIGGYRFRDFPTAGLPVLLAVLAATMLALAFQLP